MDQSTMCAVLKIALSFRWISVSIVKGCTFFDEHCHDKLNDELEDVYIDGRVS